MRTLILGCGPAGLLAAHAVRQSTGEMPTIMSKPPVRKSEMYGAQYLHKPIPALKNGAGSMPVTIDYTLWGDVEAYRTKVYGDTPVDSVSPEDYTEPHDAWDIRLAYNELWQEFWDHIEPRDLKAATSGQLADLFNGYDLVVSSIPKPMICKAGHQFASESIWAIGDAPERGVKCPVRVAHNTVVCNGDPEPAWYRASNVFGYCTVEYPGGSQPPYPGAASVEKPLRNNCDCWPNVLHVGRYGKWEKGVLSHHAYEDTLSALSVRP